MKLSDLFDQNQKRKYFLWALAVIFIATVLIANSPFHLVKIQSFIPKEASTSSEVQTSILELSKNNIDRVDTWFSIMLNISAAFAAFLAIGFVIVAFTFMDKIAHINKLLEEASAASEKAKAQIDATQNLLPDTFTATAKDREEASKSASPSPSVSVSPSPSPSPPPETESQELAKQNFELSKFILFEKVYRQIFGSQLYILKSLRGNKPTYSYNRQFLEMIHDKSNWKQINFDDYIKFLLDAFLIGKNVSDNTYYLTNLGKEFLDYLLDNGLPDKAD